MDHMQCSSFWDTEGDVFSYCSVLQGHIFRSPSDSASDVRSAISKFASHLAISESQRGQKCLPHSFHVYVGLGAALVTPPAWYHSPHVHIASMIGRRLSPVSVSAYSTRGGTSG